MVDYKILDEANGELVILFKEEGRHQIVSARYDGSDIDDFVRNLNPYSPMREPIAEAATFVGKSGKVVVPKPVEFLPGPSNE